MIKLIYDPHPQPSHHRDDVMYSITRNMYSCILIHVKYIANGIMENNGLFSF